MLTTTCLQCVDKFKTESRSRKFCSPSCWHEYERKNRVAENNPAWKGNSVQLNGLHNWVKTRFPAPKLCQSCSKCPPVDLANISQKYKRDLSDWEWLCRKCHMLKDGRLKNFNKLTQSRNSELRKRRTRPCIICKKVKVMSRLETKSCSPECGVLLANQTKQAKRKEV